MTNTPFVYRNILFLQGLISVCRLEKSQLRKKNGEPRCSSLNVTLGSDAGGTKLAVVGHLSWLCSGLTNKSELVIRLVLTGVTIFSGNA